MGLGTAGILCYWALQEYAVLAVDHCRDTCCYRALLGYSAVGHCRNTVLLLGLAGILGGWALQGYLVVEHCKDTLPLGTAVRFRAEGEGNVVFQNPTTLGRWWGIKPPPQLSKTSQGRQKVLLLK